MLPPGAVLRRASLSWGGAKGPWRPCLPLQGCLWMADQSSPFIVRGWVLRGRDWARASLAWEGHEVH